MTCRIQHNFTLTPTAAAPNVNNTLIITFNAAVSHYSILLSLQVLTPTGRDKRLPRLQPHQSLPADLQEQAEWKPYRPDAGSCRYQAGM